MLRVALLACLALAPRAGATTLERLSQDQLIQKSNLIVRCKAISSSSTLRGRIIFTVHRLQVIESLKGTVPATLEVSVPGGELNGMRQTFPGAPQMSGGQEYVAFIWTSARGVNQIIGLHQGLFDVKSVSGSLVISRGISDAEMVDRDGRTVADAPVSMRLDDLRTRVRRQESVRQ